MNVKDILRDCTVSNQRIILKGAIDYSEYDMVSMWLQRRLEELKIPHFRPIAYTFLHHENLFTKSSMISNPVFGESLEKVSQTISKNIAAGNIYVPDRNVWGYTSIDSVTEPSKFAEVFGFGVKGSRSVKSKIRNILTGDENDYRVMIFRASITENKWIYSNDYIVPASEFDAEDTVCDVPIKQFDNVYGNQMLHKYFINCMSSIQGTNMRDLNPVFIILLKRGKGQATASENSLSIIKEFRDSFCFCDTRYDLSDLMKIIPYNYGDLGIKLEYCISSPDEHQVQEILRNI